MEGNPGLTRTREDFYRAMIQNIGGKHEAAAVSIAACDPLILELQGQVLTKERYEDPGRTRYFGLSY